MPTRGLQLFLPDPHRRWMGAREVAVVIGGRPLFGATTVGSMARNNTNLPGADYFGRANNGWEADNSIHRDLRFVVEGTPTNASVPEPTTAIVWSLGSFLCLAIRRFKHQRKCSAFRVLGTTC